MKFLDRIPAVVRRKARARAEHRGHMEFLAALRRAGAEQAADPDMELTRRIYAIKIAPAAGGRHRAA